MKSNRLVNKQLNEYNVQYSQIELSNYVEYNLFVNCISYNERAAIDVELIVRKINDEIKKLKIDLTAYKSGIQGIVDQLSDYT